ncbi:hypothetical protein AYO44_05510 [Planctomycetaceae bacterium SCGC AG-212-F19]|nr:hypothetical protein AYO44_05510 [Planctomycetaceae bacterium SCGC AG-212-F19]
MLSLLLRLFLAAIPLWDGIDDQLAAQLRSPEIADTRIEDGNTYIPSDLVCASAQSVRPIWVDNRTGFCRAMVSHVPALVAEIQFLHLALQP